MEEDLAHLEDLYHSLSWDGDIVAGESLKQHLISKKKEPLLKKESDEVREVWKSSADDEIIYRLTGASIDGKGLRTLMPGVWLNDQVVNLYMALLNERSKVLYKWTRNKRSYFFNSFFLVALTNSEGGFNYDRVREWTSAVNVFKSEKLFFPIFGDNHWMLVIVFLNEKRIQFFNSAENLQVKKGEHSIAIILRWLSCEFLRIQEGCSCSRSEMGGECEVCQEKFLVNDWKKVLSCQEMPTPQQKNGFDCGVFMLTFAEFIADDLPISSIDQDLISLCREKIAFNLLHGGIPSYERSLKEDIKKR